MTFLRNLYLRHRRTALSDIQHLSVEKNSFRNRKTSTVTNLSMLPMSLYPPTSVSHPVGQDRTSKTLYSTVQNSKNSDGRVWKPCPNQNRAHSIAHTLNIFCSDWSVDPACPPGQSSQFVNPLFVTRWGGKKSTRGHAHMTSAILSIFYPLSLVCIFTTLVDLVFRVCKRRFLFNSVVAVAVCL